MYLGDEGGLPVRDDLVEVEWMLESYVGVDQAVLEQFWEEPLEFEY